MVVIVFVVPYVTFGGLWVRFCVGVIYFWCAYILFIWWIEVRKNVTCRTSLLAAKINNICGMKRSDHRGGGVRIRNIAQVDFSLRRRNGPASPCMRKKHIALPRNRTHSTPHAHTWDYEHNYHHTNAPYFCSSLYDIWPAIKDEEPFLCCLWVCFYNAFCLFCLH